MIASGVKKEEYREIKKHWITRLMNHNLFPIATRYKDNESEVIQRVLDNAEYFNTKRIKHFDKIVFTNGYSKDAPTITVQCLGIEIKEGNPEWGAEPNKKYFVLLIGDVV